MPNAYVGFVADKIPTEQILSINYPIGKYLWQVKYLFVVLRLKKVVDR